MSISGSATGPFEYSSFGVRTSNCFDAGVGYGTTYSYQTACSVCGTGAVQVGELKIPLSKPPAGKIACSWFGHVIVQRPLLSDLIKAGLDERDTRRVVWKKPIASEWFQLLPRFTLPPMEASSPGVKKSNDPSERTCPACGRDGNWGDPSLDLQIVLSRAKLVRLMREIATMYPAEEVGNIAIFHTWECMAKTLPGDSIPPRLLAFPIVVVHDSLLQVFIEHCGRKILHESVSVVD